MRRAESRESVRAEARVTIDVRDRSGRLLRRLTEHNLVTLAGRDLICSRLVDASDAAISHVAVGTGSTAPAAGDTTLGTEVYRSALTQSSLSVGQGKVTFRHYLSTTEGNGNTLAEAGLLNASSGGTLVARVTHDSISKTSSIAVTYTWEITVTAS